MRFLNKKRLEKVVAEQDRDRKQRSGDSGHSRPAIRPVPGIQVIIVCLSLAAATVAVYGFGASLGSTASVCSFCAYVAATFVQYRVNRSVLVAGYRVLRVFVVILIPLLAIHSAASLLEITAAVTQTTLSEELRLLLEERTQHARWSLYALFSLFAMVVVYAMWKLKSERFSEARVGTLKDMLVRVEEQLRSQAASPEDNRREALRIVLESLRSLIQLSPWNWALRLAWRIRHRSVVTSVVYLVPEEPPAEVSHTVAESADAAQVETTGASSVAVAPRIASRPLGARRFRILDAAFPQDAPEFARRQFEWIRQNHRPVALDRKQYDHWVAMARGDNPSGWEERFMNFSGRQDVISLTGWVYDSQELVISQEAEKCCAFDSSYVKGLASIGGAKADTKWIEVKSFIAAPVGSTCGEPSGVLLVMKNAPSGFAPEDAELVEAAIQLIQRVQVE